MGFVIVGDGAAGTAAAQVIRARAPDAQIQVVSDDPNPSYFRAALTNYLIGELQERQIFAVAPDFYERHRIERRRARVRHVDTSARRLDLDDGETLGFDRLVLATGARPRRLNVPDPGSGRGMVYLRTLRDANRILEQIRDRSIRHAVIVGGGPLGLEWVQAFREKKVGVTLLVRSRQLLPQALDATASDLVLQRLERGGVQVQVDEIEATEADADGRAQKVRLVGGDAVACDFVGVAIGTVPNTEAVHDSAIECDRTGIRVGADLETSVSGVYAGGDVAAVDGARPIGLWAPAREQGQVIGENACGGRQTWQRGVHYFATRLFDLDFAQLGVANPGPNQRETVRRTPARGRIGYQKLVFDGAKLVGAILLGERDERIRQRGRHLQTLIAAQIDVAEIGDQLLAPDFDLAGWIARVTKTQAAPPRADVPPRDVDLGALRGREVGIDQAPSRQRAVDAVLIVAGGTAPVGDTCGIGRASGNTVRLDDGAVAAHHARVRWDGRRYVLEPVDADHAELAEPAQRAERAIGLNGRAIRGATPLRPGDAIEIGTSRLVFELRSAKMPAAPTEPAAPVELGTLHMTFSVPRTVVDGPAAATGASASAGLRLDGPGGAHELVLASQVLGRGSGCELFVDHRSVAAAHAELLWIGDVLYVRDLGSPDGTRVNGDTIFAPRRLAPNDRLGAGELQWTVRAATRPTAASMRLPHDPIRLAFEGGTSQAVFPGATIGRDSSCAVTIDDDSVSSRHAAISSRDGGLELRDLDSTNGVFVDGERLGDPAVPLRIGSNLRFGGVEAVVQHVGGADRINAVVIAGPRVGERRLLQGSLRIGRDADASAWTFDEASLSRAHVELTIQGGYCVVADLGSRNGSRLAGERLGSSPVLWLPGTELRLGKKLTLRLEVG